MHVGVNRANTRAVRFWHGVGFIELDIPDARGGRTIASTSSMSMSYLITFT